MQGIEIIASFLRDLADIHYVDRPVQVLAGDPKWSLNSATGFGSDLGQSFPICQGN